MWDGRGVNFSLFSAHATKVELCLFDSQGATELERVELPEFTDEIWHGYLEEWHPIVIGCGRFAAPVRLRRDLRPV